MYGDQQDNMNNLLVPSDTLLRQGESYAGPSGVHFHGMRNGDASKGCGSGLLPLDYILIKGWKGIALCIELIVEDTDYLFFFSNRHLYADRKAIHEKSQKSSQRGYAAFSDP